VILPHDEAGRGPAVVLLHAGIADRRMWAEHLEPLGAAGYRVVAVDLPGFGEAAPAPGEQAPWRDVVETMDALGIDRAALVGNSFGGAVALRVAVVSPERVSALALVSAPPVELDPSPQLAAAWAAENEALDRGDVDAAVAAVVDAWTLPDAPAELRDRLGAMQRRAVELQMAAPEEDEAPDPVEENPELLGAIGVPVLVLAGDRDMPDFRDGAATLAAALPGAEHVVLPAAGHLAPLEAPEAFRDLVLGLLRR
jgi:pimeloyl-ACP methyl ester carboxylesterase